jgi:hypothetical protein
MTMQGKLSDLKIDEGWLEQITEMAGAGVLADCGDPGEEVSGSSASRCSSFHAREVFSVENMVRDWRMPWPNTCCVPI